MPHKEREPERSFLIMEVVAQLGVSRRTVYYWIRSGRLRTIRTRGGSQRVLLSSIERLRQESRSGRSHAEALAFQVQPLSGDAE
jgi:excisionase family DNA binding protein